MPDGHRSGRAHRVQSLQSGVSLVCEHIHFAYRPSQPVLTDVSLSAETGSILTLLGPNGSGKTTLMRLLAGASSPSQGRVLVESKAAARLTAHERAQRIAFVPQHPALAFAYPLRTYVAMGRFALGRRTAAVFADEAMKRLDLMDLSDRPVTELSAGQRHRAALARALCQLLGERPAGTTRYLLADEPVAALDPRHALFVTELFKQLAQEGVTVVLVLHDLALAARISDRLALLSSQGRLIASGPPAEVLGDPALESVFGVSFERLESGGSLAALIPGRLAARADTL